MYATITEIGGAILPCFWGHERAEHEPEQHLGQQMLPARQHLQTSCIHEACLRYHGGRQAAHAACARFGAPRRGKDAPQPSCGLCDPQGPTGRGFSHLLKQTLCASAEACMHATPSSGHWVIDASDPFWISVKLHLITMLRGQDTQTRLQQRRSSGRVSIPRRASPMRRCTRCGLPGRQRRGRRRT